MFHLPGLDTRTLSEEGLAMTVTDPLGRPAKSVSGKTVTITLQGPDSEAYRLFSYRQMRTRIVRASQGLPEPSYADVQGEVIAVLAEITTGWEGIEDAEGEPIPLNVETALELYRLYPNIRDQADSFVGSRARFTKAS